MDILVVHNSYRQRGGEDEVFEAEAALLESRGHRVLTYRATNDSLDLYSPAGIAAGTIWNRESYRTIRELIRRDKPQVMHVHNTLPLISPAVYYAARREGVPVVQTLHNYRLLCPAGTLFRDGAPCQECVGQRFAWPAVAHGCYRDSRAASGAVSTMLTFHRLLGTWKRAVDVYVTLTEASRQLFIQAGLPDGKVVVKSNFVSPDPAASDMRKGYGTGDYALFVGRLTPEKGIATLLRAWRESMCPVPLRIAGDGPMRDEVQQAARDIPGISWLGALPKQQVFEQLASAGTLIVPSEWSEPFSLAVIEAYAMGVPVIAAASGALAEIVRHGETGLHYTPGNSRELSGSVQQLFSGTALRSALGQRARLEYEQRYTAGTNYLKLMEAYHLAIGGRSRTRIAESGRAAVPGVRFYTA